MFADVDDLCAELGGQHSDGVEVLVFEAESLGGREGGGWEGGGRGRGRGRGKGGSVGGVCAAFEILDEDGLLVKFCVRVVWSAWLECRAACELLFEVFWAEDRDFDEEELARDDFCVCVIQDGPDRDLVGRVRVRVRVCQRWVKEGENKGDNARGLRAVVWLARRRCLVH